MHQSDDGGASAADPPSAQQGTAACEEFRRRLPSNCKLALLVLGGGSCCRIPTALDLGDGLWFLPANPLRQDESFARWHGSLADELVRSSGFCLAAIGGKGLDDRELRRRVMLLYDGVVILSLPRLGKGWLFSLNDTLAIKSWSRPPQRYVVAQYASTGSVTEATLRDARALADGLRAVPQGSRLDRGAYALEQALQECRLQERLHKLVRALEALVKPKTGRTRRQFVHRCQTFAAPGASAESALGEVYDIRCAVEHMNDGLSVAAEIVLKERLAQVEYLALRTYARVLKEPSVRRHFESDAAIDAFWPLKDHERQQIWGPGVKLDSEAVPRHYYSHA